MVSTRTDGFIGDEFLAKGWILPHVASIAQVQISLKLPQSASCGFDFLPPQDFRYETFFVVVQLEIMHAKWSEIANLPKRTDDLFQIAALFSAWVGTS
jgi:hypothetical protein